MIEIVLRIGGQPLVAQLDDDALAAIASTVAPTTEPTREWFSVDNAAVYMGVSPERVRKLIARQAVAYSQEGPGCRVLLARADLDRYLNDHRHEARPQ